ncbi:MAG: hypothetical protein RDA78_03000 [Roseibium sp.]|uniref:hypothetical protein n=1 Tax=Roseibium sp. TaxID=1936156 RepID=UPI003D9C48B3
MDYGELEANASNLRHRMSIAIDLLLDLDYVDKDGNRIQKLDNLSALIFTSEKAAKILQSEIDEFYSNHCCAKAKSE